LFEAQEALATAEEVVKVARSATNQTRLLITATRALKAKARYDKARADAARGEEEAKAAAAQLQDIRENAGAPGVESAERAVLPQSVTDPALPDALEDYFDTSVESCTAEAFREAWKHTHARIIEMDKADRMLLPRRVALAATESKRSLWGLAD
jgi:hypothetical protein